VTLQARERSRLTGALVWVAIVTLAFVQPLIRLIALAVNSDLFSYIPLVPFVTGYLIYLGRHAVAPSRMSVAGTAVMVATGAAALAAGFGFRERLSANDAITLMTLAYVSFVAAGGFLFLGAAWMKAMAFPIAFLAFMIPLPDAVVNALETASVQGSAEVAAFLIDSTGTPLLRDGLIFRLPTIALQVAQECSGIRSSWVLLMTSLLASYLFLNSPWRRIALVAFVIPLGIVRNGFRILVLALLCVHVGPQMIDSVIHHRGGPLFFVLSLAPLFVLLWWLKRQDR
jgi:exosortase C (VPDSG-CTERM-specific)